MNFFEHQAKARKQSRWIIIGFLLVALLIVLVINALVYFMLGSQGMLAGQYSNVQSHLFSTGMLSANSELILTTSGIVAGLIGLSSLGKIVSLRSGGGKVARDMGATIVTPDTKDSLRRRLYNVVEEIALASGVPVPEVYVMENEPGINAFAAGYSPADAAIAVTQGTLEKLDRAELQGVIAHEFSHIFNGDMRINIKMMGVIFGIMVIAILGRKFMSASRYRMSSSRNNNGNAIVFVGLGLMVVGYIGLFFARWMKSALSRQREYLADASAVQFTRDPSSIAGALKKIAAFNHSSYLTTENEEVSHMLFGSGTKSLMFATHPPLVDRIQRLERGFKESDIADLSAKLKKQEQREHVQAQKAQEEQQKRSEKKLKGGMFDVETIISNIGNPDMERIAAAAVLADTLSDGLSSAAHSLEWAPEVLFYCLLDSDEQLREQQKLIVTKFMGDISEKKLNILIKDNDLIKSEQRLALFDICFPTLKRRPVHEIEKILHTIEQMSLVDNKIDPFEFLLSSLVSKYLHEAHIPNRTKLHGNKKISSCIDEITLVISAIATHGQAGGETSEGLQKAQKAFRSGMESLGINHKNLTFNDDWHKKMTEALERLNKLNPSEKQKVISALAKTVLDDNELITEEQEMLRVVSALINVPLPILQTV